MARKNKGLSDSYVPIRRYISSEHVRAILNTLSDKRDSLLIHVLYEVGCTVSELVGIKVEDIQANSIIVGKQRRKVEISIELREEIGNYLKKFSSSDFLFSSRQSAKLNARRVQQIVKKYLGTKPSELRHARIVELAKEKGIKEIKKSCGLKRLKEKSFLKRDEIQELQNSISDKKHSIMLNLLLEAGCLISELVELRVENVKENFVSVGSPTRKVGISDKLAHEIKSFVSEQHIEGFLFTTRQSNTISDKRVFQILKDYGNAVGIKLNPRILRNTKLASMIQAGEDKSKIELELGIKRLEFGSYGLLNKNE